jgi:hypothetical protein
MGAQEIATAGIATVAAPSVANRMGEVVSSSGWWSKFKSFFGRGKPEGGPEATRVNFFGRGEARGFTDVDTVANVWYNEGRQLSSTIANGSVSDIFIRWSPMTAENKAISEIVRVSRPGTRITIMQAGDAAAVRGQANQLIEAFGGRASIKSEKTFISQHQSPGVQNTIIKLEVNE